MSSPRTRAGFSAGTFTSIPLEATLGRGGIAALRKFRRVRQPIFEVVHEDQVVADPAGRLLSDTVRRDGSVQGASELVHVHASKTGQYPPVFKLN